MHQISLRKGRRDHYNREEMMHSWRKTAQNEWNSLIYRRQRDESTLEFDGVWNVQYCQDHLRITSLSMKVAMARLWMSTRKKSARAAFVIFPCRRSAQICGLQMPSTKHAFLHVVVARARAGSKKTTEEETSLFRRAWRILRTGRLVIRTIKNKET